MRFLFYSHDGLGLGHTRRHLAVASAVAEQAPEAAILLATGAEEIARSGLPRQVEILKLPGLRKDANEKYSARRLRVTVEEIRELRSAILLTAVKAFRPGVVLVDKHPFGVSGEFKAGLKALLRAGGHAVLGLRDILDEPGQVLREWRPRKLAQRIARYYEQVLIYGQRAVFDPVTAYGFPRALAERTRFCGYVFCQESALSLENFDWPFLPPESRRRPVVLATTGGGEDGFRTLETFMRAAAGAPWDAVAIAGPMTPDSEQAVLENLAAQAGVRFRRFVPHLSALFGYIDALVCMGGYNTLAEAAAVGVPTVCIPRVMPRKEQLMRAEAFERLGLLHLCRPEELNPVMLRKKIDLALNTPADEARSRAWTHLSFNGACRAAEHLLGMAAGRPQPASSEIPDGTIRTLPA
jgi:predicted glycosyltransferase